MNAHELLGYAATLAKRNQVARQIACCDGYESVKAIRKFYAMAELEILDAGPMSWGIDPYEVDWLHVFTPIEQALWSDIRSSNLVAYPQYPVGRYIVDFGNPCARIAIECDGAQFHKNKEKDRRRDDELMEMGWSVYRISGRDCITESD